LAIPHFDPNYLGKYENNKIKKIKRNVYTASSLDLMSLFDFSCEPNGGWCFKTLRVREAQKDARGKNITVANLDHSFNKSNPALLNRIVSPHSFIEGVPALSEESDHGTSMAVSLVNVAPDVKIMPVVIFGNSNPEIIYTIGTNFLDNESSITWGVSQTAPIVSGVIAMMKEIIPNLEPKEIKQILLQSSRTTLDGISILDAEKALKNL